MNIILRLIYANLNWIAVKITFLWSLEHGIYATASFAASVTPWSLRNGTQNFTPVILYMNIICIAQRHSDANIENLHYPSAIPWRHILFKPWNNIEQTRVIFYPEYMTSFLNITSQLRLGPFLRDAAHIGFNKVRIPHFNWFHIGVIVVLITSFNVIYYKSV